ncbi:MAG: FHA domain-containing protein [Lentisphaerae bacterium]|jgi:MoxR-like ATPase|nr:FHA domain-containing protein [Lentisphaerota bacterium]MBT4823042.1 FHA domain-containing protein [Lentisphaerota bacterium]MBT5610807.1 FHA domain-containing protein [Lentisphaerota bacterium]MBT7053761.1 FHA domain-containing protein [Lentisphaerota bacterium]MBT7841222.1 FHA domain-containing protein [Lentisphaerota bacterium]
MAKLEILEGPDSGRKFQIDGGRLIIGRGPECDIRLSQGSISRNHAAIDLVDGTWFIEDLGSQNGVFIEGDKVKRAELNHQTKLQLGTIMTLFDADFGDQDISITGGDSEPDVDEFEVSIGTATQVGDAGQMDVGMIENIQQMADVYASIESEFGRMIVGQRAVLEELLIAIAAGGHCLMIGLPGLAKTLMVSTLSNILRLQFKRIQFTPDLMPSDIIGTDVLEINETTNQKTFRFIKGPIFANLLLADEINRTPPKTQAALLEAMQERQVTVANHVFPLPPPFFVLATQNPLEQEGTYPLPEAQLDRFMFNIMVDYPTEDEEEQIVEATTIKQSVDLKQVLSAQDLIGIQNYVRELPVSRHVLKYATRLVRSTRPKCESAPQFIQDNVFCGAGPRAAQFLVLGAKARSVLHGRLNVSCEDVKALALPVLRHRIFTNFTADSEGIGPDDLVQQLLVAVPEPDPSDY